MLRVKLGQLSAGRSVINAMKKRQQLYVHPTSNYYVYHHSASFPLQAQEDIAFRKTITESLALVCTAIQQAQEQDALFVQLLHALAAKEGISLHAASTTSTSGKRPRFDEELD